MDKAGSEGKPWISGLYEYRVTPHSSSIASPLQLITQCTPREKDLPQLPSTLGAQEMYEIHQELIRRQQNKPEKNYIELTPGMLVWVQHRQNTSWEPATFCIQELNKLYSIVAVIGIDYCKRHRILNVFQDHQLLNTMYIYSILTTVSIFTTGTKSYTHCIFILQNRRDVKYSIHMFAQELISTRYYRTA